MRQNMSFAVAGLCLGIAVTQSVLGASAYGMRGEQRVYMYKQFEESGVMASFSSDLAAAAWARCEEVERLYELTEPANTYFCSEDQSPAGTSPWLWVGLACLVVVLGQWPPDEAPNSSPSGTQPPAGATASQARQQHDGHASELGTLSRRLAQLQGQRASAFEEEDHALVGSLESEIAQIDEEIAQLRSQRPT